MAQYFDSNTESYIEIPKSPYYVLSNDSFMSGWGHARGKINTCIVPCETYNIALKVVEYIESRNDQKYIRLNTTPPRSKSHVIYSLQLGWLNRTVSSN